MIFRIFIDEAVAIPRVGSLRMAVRLAMELQAENPVSRVVVAVKRRAPVFWDATPNRWEPVVLKDAETAARSARHRARRKRRVDQDRVRQARHQDQGPGVL